MLSLFQHYFVRFRTYSAFCSNTFFISGVIVLSLFKFSSFLILKNYSIHSGTCGVFFLLHYLFVFKQAPSPLYFGWLKSWLNSPRVVTRGSDSSKTSRWTRHCVLVCQLSHCRQVHLPITAHVINNLSMTHTHMDTNTHILIHTRTYGYAHAHTHIYK